MQALIQRGIEEFGRNDTLINNAGIGMHARFEELPNLSIIEKIMLVNYWGSVFCTLCSPVPERNAGTHCHHY
jgi:NAD(P)-dependent dehydrogenase (short-subunit alcohol dehydrogenase family)